MLLSYPQPPLLATKSLLLARTIASGPSPVATESVTAKVFTSIIYTFPSAPQVPQAEA